MQEHRRALERFYDAFNARDLPCILAELHPQIEFESRFARAGGTTYHGHDGVRGWLADLADAWEHIEVELERPVRRPAIARSRWSRCAARAVPAGSSSTSAWHTS